MDHPVKLNQPITTEHDEDIHSVIVNYVDGEYQIREQAIDHTSNYDGVVIGCEIVTTISASYMSDIVQDYDYHLSYGTPVGSIADHIIKAIH